MFQRQKTGSVVCRSCGRLVGVNDSQCFNCGARNPGLWGYAPLLRKLGYNLGFIQIVIGVCSALYLLMLLFDPAGIQMSGTLSLLSPSPRSLLVFGATGVIPVLQYGRWWTLLSAGWLHAGLLHILFNLLWVRQVGPAVGEIYGTSRLVIIYTVSSAAGFLLSTLSGHALTLGASAAIFGLFGSLVWAGRKTGSTEIGRQSMIYAVIIFAFGFVMPGIDNAAHLGGFLGGLGVGAVLNPLRSESYGDFAAAFVCLVATLLSLVASVLTVFI